MDSYDIIYYLYGCTSENICEWMGNDHLGIRKLLNGRDDVPIF